jgi:hypothetical protein
LKFVAASSAVSHDKLMDFIERADAAERYFSHFDNRVPLNRLPLYIAEKSHGGIGEARVRLRRAIEDAEQLASRLREVNPLVIDYFLGQNVRLQPIGTLLIAWVILECEAAYLSVRGNINRRKQQQKSTDPTKRYGLTDDDLKLFKDDWYRFIGMLPPPSIGDFP